MSQQPNLEKPSTQWLAEKMPLQIAKKTKMPSFKKKTKSPWIAYCGETHDVTISEVLYHEMLTTTTKEVVC